MSSFEIANLPVERLRSADMTPDMVWAIVELQRDAYRAQLEGPGKVFEPGYMDKVSQWKQGRLEAEAASYARSAANDWAQYWVVRHAGEPYKLASFVEARTRTNSLAIDSILTDPQCWRQGLGSRTLLAALQGSGLPDSAYATLEAYPGSSVNKWYESLGFQYVDTPAGLYEDFSCLPMITRPEVALGGLIHNLQSRAA